MRNIVRLLFPLSYYRFRRGIRYSDVVFCIDLLILLIVFVTIYSLYTYIIS